jgi:hypothetical protein
VHSCFAGTAEAERQRRERTRQAIREKISDL